MSAESEILKKPYESPQLKSRTFEQASLFLVGHAWNGDHAARDLLRLLFALRGEQSFEIADKNIGDFA